MSSYQVNAKVDDISFDRHPSSVDANSEGHYRRGYHQAVAEIVYCLRQHGAISADSLESWVENEGMQWRKDMPMEKKISPPKLPA